MPLKLLRTLMSNWINVEEDDIDHDEDAASKMIPEMLTLTHATSCDITGHRDIGDDDDMVTGQLQMESDNARWEMLRMIVITKSSQSQGTSPQPSHNITSYKTAKCSHVTPSQEN